MKLVKFIIAASTIMGCINASTENKQGIAMRLPLPGEGKPLFKKEEPTAKEQERLDEELKKLMKRTTPPGALALRPEQPKLPGAIATSQDKWISEFQSRRATEVKEKRKNKLN